MRRLPGPWDAWEAGIAGRAPTRRMLLLAVVNPWVVPSYLTGWHQRALAEPSPSPREPGLHLVKPD